MIANKRVGLPRTRREEGHRQDARRVQEAALASEGRCQPSITPLGKSTKWRARCRKFRPESKRKGRSKNADTDRDTQVKEKHTQNTA